MEEILGTEPLSGTYDDRKKTANILRKDRMIREWEHQQKLKIFDKQEEDFKKKLIDKEKVALINKRVEYLLYHLCEPKAFEYLNWLRHNNSDLLHKLVYCLIPPKDMRNLENYCARIFKLSQEGRKPSIRIKMSYIVKLMRAITGMKAKIMVERDGKRTEMSEMWTDNKEE